METNQTHFIIPKLPEPKFDELPKFPSYLYEIKIDYGMTKKDKFITPRFELNQEIITIYLKGGTTQSYLNNIQNLDIKIMLDTPELHNKITTLEDYFRACGMMK